MVPQMLGIDLAENEQFLLLPRKSLISVHRVSTGDFFLYVALTRGALNTLGSLVVILAEINSFIDFPGNEQICIFIDFFSQLRAPR